MRHRYDGHPYDDGATPASKQTEQGIARLVALQIEQAAAIAALDRTSHYDAEVLRSGIAQLADIAGELADLHHVLTLLQRGARFSEHAALQFDRAIAGGTVHSRRIRREWLQQLARRHEAPPGPVDPVWAAAACHAVGASVAP